MHHPTETCYCFFSGRGATESRSALSCARGLRTFFSREAPESATGDAVTFAPSLSEAPKEVKALPAGIGVGSVWAGADAAIEGDGTAGTCAEDTPAPAPHPLIKAA